MMMHTNPELLQTLLRDRRERLSRHRWSDKRYNRKRAR